MRNYNREDVIYKLIKKGIKVIGGLITIPKDLDVGIKTWGMIDFLKSPWKRKEK